MEQVADEVDSICEAVDELYERFGFGDYEVELSTRPDKSIGTDEEWDRATEALREALERQGRDYRVSPGEGTFYGPKIDFHITDALGRSWQCGTCQVDFQMPQRFELTYQGEDNAEHRPVMIHRALPGLDGALRGDPHRALRRAVPRLARAGSGRRSPGGRPPHERAREVAADLEGRGLRVSVDERGESVGRKIRDAELRKLPYMVVIGDRRWNRAGSRSGPTTKATSGAMTAGTAARRRRVYRVNGRGTPLYTHAPDGGHQVPRSAVRAPVPVPVCLVPSPRTPPVSLTLPAIPS